MPDFGPWALARGDRFAVINPSVNAPSAKVSPLRDQDCTVTFTVEIRREDAKLPRRGPEIGDREYAGPAAVAAVRLLAEAYGVVSKPPDYEAEMASLKTKLADVERELRSEKRGGTSVDKLHREMLDIIDEQVISAPNPTDQPQTPPGPSDNPALEAGPQSVVKPKRQREAAE